MEFGTGVVKITPAHDPNDFEVGERHNLERIVVINKNGTMNENALSYKGMDRFACREKLVNDLKEQGLLIKEEKIIHSVGHSERTDVMVEPYLSKQWFVKMDVLAARVLENQEDKENKINFVPKRFEKVLNQYENNEIYELSSPYLENELFELDYTQQLDIITLVHKNHPPMELSRIKHNQWELNEINF